MHLPGRKIARAVLRRAPLAALGAAFLVTACGDGGAPFDSQSAFPAFEIADGAHPTAAPAGNPRFFFLTPIVNQGSFVGELDPDLIPLVEVCAGTAVDCGADAVFAGEAELTGGHYHLNWSTRGVAAGSYRLGVSVGGMQLGHADVQIVSRRSANGGGDDVVLAQGRTLPVRFRVEEGALCDPPLTDAELGTRACIATSVVPAEGGQVVTEVEDETGTPTTVGVVVPPQEEGSDPITFVIQPCADNGGPPDLGIDLPTFGPCIQVDANGLEGSLGEPAIVFACIEKGDLNVGDLSLGADLTDAQEELIRIHRKDASGVSALPLAEDPCEELISSAAPANPIVRLARAGWRATFGRVFSPEPLYARLDERSGGSTPNFSDFQFALPAVMNKLPGTDGQTAGSGDPVPVPPGVSVIDVEGNPVKGARVSFGGDGTTDPTTAILSDAFGIAQLNSWTLPNMPGDFTLVASAFGVGGEAEGAPFVDPFDVVETFLGLGTQTFTATAGFTEARRAGDIVIYKNFDPWFGEAKNETTLQGAPFNLVPGTDYLVEPMSGLASGIPNTTSLIVLGSPSQFGVGAVQIDEQQAGFANLDAWVQNGGWLVAHAGDNTFGDSYTVPGLSGMVDDIHNCTGLTLNVADHAFIRGPDATLGTADDLTNTNIDNGGLFCEDNHGSLDGLLPAGALVLITEEGGAQRPAYATYPYGDGRVIVTTLTLEFGAHSARTLVNHLFWAINGVDAAPVAGADLVAGAPRETVVVRTNTDGTPRN